MTDKLQELTEKLYRDGLSKGREEADRIVAEAKAEADRIVDEANRKAEEIIADATKTAEELKSASEKDIRKASDQSLAFVKKEIGDLLLNGSLSEGIKALNDPEFIKGIIRAVAEKFNTEDDIALMLPESTREKIQPWIEKELASELGKGIEAKFSGKINGGFTIGPKDGSYYVSLTDATFRELISEYLRPTTRKVLFGE